MLSEFYNSIQKYVSVMRITDVLDILIVALLIYEALKLMRDTRAVQVLKGVLVFFALLQFSYWMKLHAMYFILQNTMQVGILALFIVFQPELRRALEHLGRSKFSSLLNFDEEDVVKDRTRVVNEIVRAAEQLSKNKIGALIVVERETKIGDIIQTGVSMNAFVTAELIVNIFVPKTPLHDGALVIKDNKIEAAACFLPLSQNQNLSKELGTRHRAALGISEDTDAVVVVVSEETGRISIAQNGDLMVNITVDTLTTLLTKDLEPPDNVKNKKNGMFLWKGKKNG